MFYKYSSINLWDRDLDYQFDEDINYLFHRDINYLFHRNINDLFSQRYKFSTWQRYELLSFSQIYTECVFSNRPNLPLHDKTAIF